MAEYKYVILPNQPIDCMYPTYDWFALSGNEHSEHEAGYAAQAAVARYERKGWKSGRTE